RGQQRPFDGFDANITALWGASMINEGHACGCYWVGALPVSGGSVWAAPVDDGLPCPRHIFSSEITGIMDEPTKAAKAISLSPIGEELKMTLSGGRNINPSCSRTITPTPTNTQGLEKNPIENTDPLRLRQFIT